LLNVGVSSKSVEKVSRSVSPSHLGKCDKLSVRVLGSRLKSPPKIYGVGIGSRLLKSLLFNGGISSQLGGYYSIVTWKNW